MSCTRDQLCVIQYSGVCVWLLGLQTVLSPGIAFRDSLSKIKYNMYRYNVMSVMYIMSAPLPRSKILSID